MEVEKGDSNGGQHDARQRETGMCRQVKHTILPNVNRRNSALSLRFQHCVSPRVKQHLPSSHFVNTASIRVDHS